MATSNRAVQAFTLASASGLHMFRHMKLFAVTMLAVVACSACGVGVDESYDGQTLVAADGQALEGSPNTTPGPTAGPTLPNAPSVPQTPITTMPSPVRDPGTVALPQDPIPVFEGKPVVPPTAPPFTGGSGPQPGR